MFARYRVDFHIGSGGMGEVYKATDTSLDRGVALKLLRTDLVHDSDRLRRFTQEAKAASALNHPNVVHIYEIGEANGTQFIAMEYVDGVSLRSTIYDQATPFPKLLPILLQVAQALAKAHAAGIVHRDLKPDNIMVSNDAYAKIVDFGLAKLIDRPAASSADVTVDRRDHTTEGVMVGTVNYMAPEQVQGLPVDPRSDIFSFGCILYEAAARRRPFEGRSNVDTLRRILHEEPAALDDAVSPGLQRIIGRCLAKDPEERYQSAKDLAIDLRALAAPLEDTARVDRSRRPRTVAIVVLLLAALASVMWFRRDHAGSSPAALRVTKLTNSGNVRFAAISPDGKYVGYIEHSRLLTKASSIWIRQLSTGSTLQIVPPHGDALYQQLAFSPEGDRLLYTMLRTDGVTELDSIPVLGGSAQALLENINCAPSFSPDGRQMAFVRDGAKESFLLTARSDGSGERELARGPTGRFSAQVAWSPDGRWIVCQSFRPSRLTLVDAQSGKADELGVRPWSWLDGVDWLDAHSIVACGRLSSRGLMEIWRIDAETGRGEPIGTTLSDYGGVSIPRDRNSILSTASTRTSNLFISPVDASHDPVQVTFATSSVGHMQLLWLPDGRIAYSTRDDRNYWTIRPDGSDARPLFPGNREYWRVSASPDGKTLLVRSTAPEMAKGDYRFFDINGRNGRVVSYLPWVGDAQFSPDGKWISYSSKREMWRVPAGGGAPVRAAASAGTLPTSSPDGRWLAYAGDSGIEVAPFSGGAVIKKIPISSSLMRFCWTADSQGLIYADSRAGGPTNLFVQALRAETARQITRFTSGEIWSFALSPDGKSLVLAQGVDEQDAVLITIH